MYIEFDLPISAELLPQGVWDIRIQGFTRTPQVVVVDSTFVIRVMTVVGGINPGPNRCEYNPPPNTLTGDAGQIVEPFTLQPVITVP